ncbi:hypothetical protein [Streptomyces sp. NBC_00576]|nr:hypothetical protein [Streptomyces sp. NBC_00576]WUB76646.1 hypothetical protein OG734_45090 [Streptomyces sp. NBC_00576]
MTDPSAVGILADVHRGVGRILLNRPKALNALMGAAGSERLGAVAADR